MHKTSKSPCADGSTYRARKYDYVSKSWEHQNMECNRILIEKSNKICYVMPPVCLHCVHRQGLTRECYGSCFLVDVTHLMFESRLRTTCSQFLSSFALLEHTTPSTQHTHIHRAHATHTRTQHNTLAAQTKHTTTQTHSHTLNRPTHTGKTDTH